MIGRILWSVMLFGLGAGVVHQYMTGQADDAATLFAVFVVSVVADCADKLRGF